MKAYCELTKEELKELQQELQKQFEDAKGKGLKLDMSRGKPSPIQLDTVAELLDALDSKSDLSVEDHIDVRNYGGPIGILEVRRFLSSLVDAREDQIIVMGNASLPIMFDSISRSFTHGVMGETPWCKLDKVKFLCPVPGYDRHFAITEYFGVEMINIPMNAEGPDMDLVEELVKDPAVKGIWCVPKYSNPNGISYSDETVRRFAALTPAAKDFRIYWDNAYAVHHLYDEEEKQDKILNILEECEKAGHPDLVLEFCSTSKVSYSGAGIAGVLASPENLAWIRSSMNIQIIGYDKINQLRHVRYYKDINGVKEQMSKHAAIMRPKFEAVEEILSRELEGLQVGEWTLPRGGYFIAFTGMEGTASKVVEKCKEAGVVLTGAGATHPYHKDPADNVIRIAPSYPTLEEMRAAAEVFTLCVKLVSVELLLQK